MNLQSDTSLQHPVDSRPAAATAVSATRPLYWSVRRELWENRSVYIAPLIAAAVMLLGFLISTIGLPHRRRALLLLDPAVQRAHIEKPYDFAAMMLILTAFIVGVFYCLDALHGERRDRSILFWKSLPVSDLTTVLSKASIPLIVLPLITFAVAVATQVDMLLLSNAILGMNGVAATTGEQLPLFRHSLMLLYGLIAMALWYAPIYGWLLLVSAWARRAAFLWAVFPVLALAALEKVAFQTNYFGSLLRYRLAGWMGEAFVPRPHGSGPVGTLTQLTPGKFLHSPGLWIGLAFAVAFLAAAVRLRHNREPI